MRFDIHSLILATFISLASASPYADDTAPGASSLHASNPTTTYTETGPATTVTLPISEVGPAIISKLSDPSCSYWLEDLPRKGKSSFNTDSTYQVFRNVRDFGAKGDGIVDDTAAINRAISTGNRCAPGACNSTTTTPAVVYFPPGTYLVSAPVIDYYYTQIIGNPNCLPVIKANAKYTHRWVIDGNPYQASGDAGYISTNVFWRQIRNLIIDMTNVAPSVLVAGIHWPTSQATSLQNIIFKMSTASGVKHEGIFIENGSGGLVTDLIFYGGNHGLTVGNQQFTMRNLTINNAVVAIFQLWDWGWTYVGVNINNCGTGLDISSINNSTGDPNFGTQSVGSVTFIDSSINNTPVGILTARNAKSAPASGGSLVLENVRLHNVPTAVKGLDGTILLAGTTGASTIKSWGQGHAYTPTGPTTFQNGGAKFPGAIRPTSLLDGTDYYTRSKPQYDHTKASGFLSVRAAGALGDGHTDDSNALQSVINTAAQSGKIVYFDAGTYLVSKTLCIPPQSRLVGEGYAVIMSSGPFFASMSSPKPVIQVGTPGQKGWIEWSDMIVSTQGAQAGAILIEWNLHSTSDTPSGMWDVHTRIGGFAGSKLRLADCPKTPKTTVTASNIPDKCIAAFMSMHITPSAAGLYMENVWLWVADHDIEDQLVTQITIYAGRGLLIESTEGGILGYGTGVEHHQLYEYQLSNTQAIFLGQLQTETAYYQPNPDARIPFPSLAAYNDPIYKAGESGLGLRILNSQDVLIYGAGMYSFFTNNNVTCSNQGNKDECQSRIFSIDSKSSVTVYNLNTVGVQNMITVDGVDVATQSDNLNGFVDTIAWFQTGS